MKNSLAFFIFGAIALVTFGAAEELAPKWLGVGFPLLLGAVHHVSSTRPALVHVIFATAAGAIEDAISSLPPMTSVSFYLATSALVSWTELPRSAILLTFPLYQLWLALWIPSLGGGVFARLLLSVPLGIAAVMIATTTLTIAERKAALDDAE